VTKVASKKTDISKESYALPASWQNAWKICAGAGALGLAAAGFGMTTDPKRFAFSYLFAFYVFLTIALGALFFVIIQRLVGAHWSVTVRRTAEFFASALPAFAVLFLPIVLNMGHLFPWLGGHGEHGAGHAGNTSLVIGEAQAAQGHGEPAAPKAEGAHAPAAHGDKAAAAPAAHGGAHAARAGHAGAPDPMALEHAELMEKKAPYLNKNFFLARAVVYLVIWSLLGWNFFKFSVRQDKDKGVAWTLTAQRWAPASTIFFGFSLTFAAFDWLMSLEPAWFSTIFGVYIFATAVVSSLATLIVVTMALRDAGPLAKVVTTEHYHDLGKLLFGFNVFWAYIGFSQMMLIWYAALPEETPWYHMRWDNGPWAGVSMTILIGHFVLPFFFLISRNVKRRLPMLRVGAMWMLLMHVVDIYWFVMPSFGQENFMVSWIDAACLLGVGGVYLAAVFYQMGKHPLIPVGDPRLARSLAFQNA
jgi:hypothetical protein